jgi:hypothetical protein
MRKKLFFILIYTVLGFGALQIPFRNVVGSKVNFTLFDWFAPISGAFLGTGLGIISVLAMQVVNLLFHGVSSIDKASIIRLVPTLFGVWFFARKDRYLLLVPALAMIAFNLHPMGRAAWPYSMFWLIPFLVWPFRERFLIAKSLGTTFTIHSVGSVTWLWTFNLPASVWISLIPVVILERSIFTLGMSTAYLLANNVLGFLAAKKLLPSGIKVAKNYLLKI